MTGASLAAVQGLVRENVPAFADTIRADFDHRLTHQTNQKWDRDTLYGGGFRGYVDYPALAG